MARNLLEPILDGGVSNPHYFEGRLLTAAALREDQEAQRAHHRRLGRALGPGVVEGLFVTLQSAGSPAEPPLLAIGAGLAVNGEGDTLELPAGEVVALARTVVPPPEQTGLFHTCPPPRAQLETPGFGFFVLALAPASGFEGRAPFSGLSDPRAGSGCGSRSAVEGVSLRMVPLDPLAVSGLTGGTRLLLENELLTSSALADRSKLRNVLAHLCLGTEAVTGFAADPFARDALEGGGSEPALAHYGALDDLLVAGGLSECDVPLALVHWPSDTGVEFVDNWAVRRRLAPPATSASWPSLSARRRRAEAEASLFQFQEHMAALVQSASAPTAISGREHFRWLPPAGLVPMVAPGRRGVSEFVFLGGLTTRQPLIYADGARLVELVTASLTQPAIDTDSGEFIWTYRIRQNDLLPGETGVERPYLVFASGHLPCVGTARFDLARWDRSSFGLL